MPRLERAIRAQAPAAGRAVAAAARAGDQAQGPMVVPERVEAPALAVAPVDQEPAAEPDQALGRDQVEQAPAARSALP